jgi:hypothetical protein
MTDTTIVKKKRVSKKVKAAVKDLMGKVFTTEVTVDEISEVDTAHQDPHVENPLLEASDAALFHLKDLILYIEYGRPEVAAKDARLAIEKIEKLRELHFEKFPEHRPKEIEYI